MLALPKLAVEIYEAVVEMVLEQILVVGNGKVSAAVTGETKLAHSFAQAGEGICARGIGLEGFPDERSLVRGN